MSKKLSLTEAAKMAGISRATMKNALSNGEISYTADKDNNRIAIDADSLKKWLVCDSHLGYTKMKIRELTGMSLDSIQEMFRNPLVKTKRTVNGVTCMDAEEINAYIKAKWNSPFTGHHNQEVRTWKLIGEGEEQLPDCKLYTATDVISKTGISHSTLSRAVLSKAIKYVSIKGERYFTAKGVNEYIDNASKVRDGKTHIRGEWEHLPEEETTVKEERKEEKKEDRTLVEIIMDELDIEPDKAYAVSGGLVIKMNSRECMVTDGNGNYRRDNTMLGKIMTREVKILGPLKVENANPKEGDMVFFYNLEADKVDGVKFSPRSMLQLMLWKMGLLYTNRNFALFEGKTGVTKIRKEWESQNVQTSVL